jgi:hypothetical protein
VLSWSSYSAIISKKSSRSYYWWCCGAGVGAGTGAIIDGSKIINFIY